MRALRRWSIVIISVLIALGWYWYPSHTWSTFTFGASLPLSGTNKQLGKDICEGAESYFHYTNDHGGIHGKPIRFICYDDKYEPQNTLRNTKKLIEKDRVFALFGFVGTPTTKAILPFIGEVPLIAPYTGAAFLRNAQKRTIVNFRSSYEEEIENSVHYLYAHKGVKRFAIFYQNDDYGIAGYNATIKALKKRGLTLSAEGTYRRNTLSIQHALQQIQLSKPEAIILVGAYKPTAHFIQHWRQAYGDETLFAPISFVNANALIHELGGQGKNIYFSQTVPAYDDNHLKLTNTYRKLLARYHPDSLPSYASFESFLAAKSVIVALKSIRGTITRQRFVHALKTLPKNALGDLPLNYQHTQLLNHVYLSIYREGTFHIVGEK